jgi:catechol 2,3-dioxygenase-like lactoylglutathione lyase family enzyme
MSYIALVTDQFDEMVHFYGTSLGFPVVEQWDRANARGKRFDLGALRLEILDNRRERRPLSLGEPADRFHVVIEVDDIDAARAKLEIDTPRVVDTSWGARLFELRDPDAIRVTYLQWIQPQRDAP